ncbi:class I SAM-dependent methyltransferase [Streptomyces tendae]|uniref:class I SAM-dependent methyltransferase n=1 Tax=Streptomyces tendae TaxID=1932 RepID=UPI003667DB67
MRPLNFRGSGQTDYGLASYTVRDVWRNVSAAHGELLDHLVRFPMDRIRLSRALSRKNTPLLVSLGCGRTVEPGWIGLDLRNGPSIYRCDLRRPFPFADGTVDGLLAEHSVEHLLFDDISPFLKECVRVLKPGAPLRIVSPDATLIAELLIEATERTERQLVFERDLHKWSQDSLLALRSANRLAHQWGRHQSLLTPEGVVQMLERVGFGDAQVVPVTETRNFSSVPGTHMKKFPDSATEAFAVEAVRAADASQSQPSDGAARSRTRVTLPSHRP